MIDHHVHDKITGRKMKTQRAQIDELALFIFNIHECRISFQSLLRKVREVNKRKNIHFLCVCLKNNILEIFL